MNLELVCNPTFVRSILLVVFSKWIDRHKSNMFEFKVLRWNVLLFT